MNKGFTFVTALALTAVMTASIADAGTTQKSKSKAKPKAKKSVAYSGPETGLLGVKLYDSGLRVLSLYGNPDSITTVGAGATSSGGPGGGGPPGGFGGPGSGGRPAGSGGGPAAAGQDSMIPLLPGNTGALIPGSLGDPLPDMQRSGPPGIGGGSGPQPAGVGGAQGGRPSGGPTGPGGAPGGAGGATATEAAIFTRWTYTKNGCKLAFVVDKFNRVIQIEAIGLQNGRIKTRRGVGFGSSFSTIMRAYGTAIEPDGYDISGNNFTIRFLTRHRVAFRLSQLSTKKAHVVTGIVVAAGKQ